ncbi:MAG: glycosyltransferase family 39 protein [Anaerolineae bacterium]|nr:glycosyltransferase family 39 protein [Anaerolineae bacterium]MDW8171884.1 glycosyltransferase family 39 protein [Anaerolineae bacterium]
MTKPSAMRLWAMLALLVAASAARFHLLGAQSFWYDEGVSYGHTQRDLLAIGQAVRHNVHVPLYFMALNLWADLTGTSEFSLRALSALASTASVAVTYALGRRLFGPLAGLAAALLVALNGFSVTYGQEARMYALLAVLSALAMLLFVLFKEQPARRERRAAALALVHALGALTHVSFVLTLIPQGLMAAWWLLGWAWHERRLSAAWWRALGLYVLANGFMLLAVSPWLGNLLSNAEAQPDTAAHLPLSEFLALALGWLSFGPSHAQALGGMGGALAFFLLFGLIAHREDDGSAWKLALPIAWVLLSVLIYYSLGLYASYWRFLIAAQIGMALWLGRGVRVLWGWRTRDRTPPLSLVPRFAALFALAALALHLLDGLAVLYHDPAYQRDDWRGLVRSLNATMQPDDALIVAPSGLQDIVGYYDAGCALRYALPRDLTTLADDVRAIVAHSRQVRTILYGVEQHDPHNVLRRTLAQSAYPIAERWWDDMRVGHYWVGQVQVDEIIGAALGDSVRLVSAGLNSAAFKSGEVLALRLFWETSAPLATSYAVFVQLLDESGRLVAQRDSAPMDGFAPTTAWPVSAVVEDRHALLLMDRQGSPLPAGTYRLIVGLYDPTTGARLPTSEPGDFVTLAHLRLD